MATVPTPAEIERAIFDVFASRNLRAGQVIPLVQVQLALDRQGIGAAEFNSALQSIRTKGWIEPSGIFIKVTEAGFLQYGAVPTAVDIERAVLGVFAAQNVRAGGVIPLMQVQLTLDKQGIQAVEFQAGLKSLIAKGWIEQTRTFLRLSETGYDQL